MVNKAEKFATMLDAKIARKMTKQAVDRKYNKNKDWLFDLILKAANGGGNYIWIYQHLMPELYWFVLDRKEIQELLKDLGYQLHINNIKVSVTWYES